MSISRWLVLALLVALDVWLSSALAPADGDVQFAFLQALWAGIVVVGAWLADKAVTIAMVLWQVAVAIAKAMWALGVRIAHVFRQVYGLLGKFWSNVLRPFVQWTWRELTSLYRTLRRVLEPVLKFLERVRREVLKLYGKYVRPVMDTIAVMRRLLQLLAFLRLEWARELDRKLAELEDRIMLPLRLAMRYLNETINMVNSVVEGFGLFQRLALLRSLARDIYGLGKIWHDAYSRPVTDADRTAAAARDNYKTSEQVARDFTAYLQTGDGPDAPVIEELSADLWLRLRTG